MRLSLFVFIILCSKNVFGQPIRFQQQKPHTALVEALVFTPDSKTLFTGDARGEIIAWSVPEGNIVKNITDRQVPVEDLAISEDGKILLACGQEYDSDYSEITAWQWPAATKMFSVIDEQITHVIFKPSGDGFYALGKSDYVGKYQLVCKEYNLKGKKIKEALYESNSGEIHVVRLSPDGSKMALLMGKGDRYVCTIDLKKENEYKQYENASAIDVAIQNNGQWTIAYVTSEGCFSETYNPGKETFEEVPNVTYRTFMLGNENRDNNQSLFYLYSPLNNKVKELKMPEVFNILNLYNWYASPDGKYTSMILKYSDSYQALTFWNNSNGKMIWATDCLFSPVHSIDSYSDSKLVMGKRGPLEVWDPGRHDVYTEFPGGTERCLRLFTDKKTYSVFIQQFEHGYSASLVNPGKASVEQMEESGMLSIANDFSTGAYTEWSLEGRTDVHFFDPVTLREKGFYNGRKVINGVSISPTGSLCAILVENNKADSVAGIEIIETFSKKVTASFDIVRTESNPFNVDATGIIFSDDGKMLVVTTNKHTYFFDTRLNAVIKEISFHARRNSYNPVAIHPQSKIVAIAGRGGELALFEGNNGKFIGNLPGGAGYHTGMVFLPEGKILAASYWDGTVRLFDTDKKILLATFIGIDKGDYLLYTPDGYYTGTGRGLNLAGYYQGDKFVSRQTLDLRFNRPDTVMTRIGIAGNKLLKMYGTARNKRIERMPDKSLSLQAISRPVVHLTGKNELPCVAETTQLNLHIVVTDAEKELSSLRIYHNGLLVSTQTLNGKTKTISYPVELLDGNNKIEMVAENIAGVESSYEILEMYKVPAEHALPQLYLLAVGVSEFKEKERNLDFAAKDANEIAEAFEKSPAFSKINTVVLTNKEATLANFEKQLVFLQKAKAGDVVIIYFSTHGVLDEKMDYYLATYDMEFSNPQGKGIPYYKLEEIWSKLASRNRMVIMDACHSGEVDKDEAALVTTNKENLATVTAKSGSFSVAPKLGLKNSFAYMHALFDDASRSTGTHIIGAASGYQVALESGEWNNGAFTYALKAGLTLKAADLNKDDNITITELQTYLQKTVSLLTNGEQTPALRSVNRDNDFRLW